MHFEGNKIIHSEEPSDHWGFLNVKDAVVLDLGCGLFHSTISTPNYFFNQGAKTVIGVDSEGVIQGLEPQVNLNPNFISHSELIQSTEQLIRYINYNPDIIKCDIEGAEIYFKDIPVLNNVKHIGIEYHNNELKHLCLHKLKEWEFNYYSFYQITHNNTDIVGVYHAWRA
jgi:hypothetical protein